MSLRHPRRSTAAAVAATAALALALTACGGPSDTGGDPEETTLSYAYPGGGQISFDPARGSINIAAFLAPVYDTLLRRETDGSFSPALATEWEFVDPTTFVLTLRDDVVFEDGQVVDADTVVANIENVRNGAGPLASQFDLVSEVVAEDASTVRIQLSSPNPSLPIALSSVSGMIASEDALGSDELGSVPVGTGPYTMDEAASVVNDTYVFHKKADHWDADAYPYDTIEVRIIPDTAAMVSALSSGQLDVAELGSPQDIARARELGIEMALGSFNIWTVHILDREGTLQPALGDVRVRQAMNMAFDRPAIVESVQYGLGAPAAQMLKPGMPGFDEALDEAYPFDVEAAKELLAEAGYPDGFAVQMVSTPLVDSAAQAANASLAQIGIDAEIVSVTIDQYITSIVSGQYPLAMLPYGVDDPYTDMVQLVSPDGGFNPFRADDPKIVELLETIAASDAEGQEAAFSELNEYLVDIAWFIPMSRDAYAFAHSDAVTGITFEVTKPPYFRNWAPVDQG